MQVLYPTIHPRGGGGFAAVAVEQIELEVSGGFKAGVAVGEEGSAISVRGKTRGFVGAGAEGEYLGLASVEI